MSGRNSPPPGAVPAESIVAPAPIVEVKCSAEAMRSSWTEGPAAPPGAESGGALRRPTPQGHQAIQVLPNALREHKGIRMLEEALQGRHRGGADDGARPDPRERRLGRLVPPEQP